MLLHIALLITVAISYVFRLTLLYALPIDLQKPCFADKTIRSVKTRISIVAFDITSAVINLIRLAYLNAIESRFDSPHRAEHTVACIMVKGISVAFQLANAISHFTGCTERHANTIHLLLSFPTLQTISFVKVILSIIALWVTCTITYIS
jgi:hypothetical protein